VMFTAVGSVPAAETAAPPGGVLGVARQAQTTVVAVVGAGFNTYFTEKYMSLKGWGGMP